MRLLNARTGLMEEFLSDEERPPYAILSHRWGREEVSYAEWQSLPDHELGPVRKEGRRKIDLCRKQAIADGYDWVWVDTCSIDKSSSAELSEAINSMFRWYREAEVCYAFLSDVTNTSSFSGKDLMKSRWFTRGWTLQELLAPRRLVFYSKDWEFLGTKVTLGSTISSTLRIRKKYLGGENLEQASIAQKMSWAADRQTTRLEDKAYCLLGIFDINMPLIYGEGRKAFQRLQEALLLTYPEDHTLFAWGTVVSQHSTVPDSSIYWTRQSPPWKPDENAKLRGMFAASPKDFENSHDIVPSSLTEAFYHSAKDPAALPVTAGNGAVRLELPVIRGHDGSIYYWDRPKIAQFRGFSYVVLLCGPEEGVEIASYTVLLLKQSSDMILSRTRELTFTPNNRDPRELFASKQVLTVKPEPKLPLKTGDIVFRRRGYTTDAGIQTCEVMTYQESRWILNTNVLKTNGNTGILGGYSYTFLPAVPNARLGFAIVLSRVELPYTDESSLAVALVPLCYSSDEKVVFAKFKGTAVEWHHPKRYATVTPRYRHVMQQPSDTWTLEEPPFPTVYIHADRVPVDDETGYIDVLDVIVSKSKGW